MSLKEEYWEKFNRYFTGLMTVEEKKELANELMTSSELREDFRLESILYGNDIYQSFEDDLDLMSDADKEDLIFLHGLIENNKRQLNKTKVTKVNVFPFSFAIAASVAGLISITLLAMLFNGEKPHREIVKSNPSGQVDTVKNKDNENKILIAYNTFYEPFEINGLPPLEMQQPIALYNERKINESIKELNNYSGSRAGETDSSILVYRDFYKGLCYLELKSPGKAIDFLVPAFNHVSETPKLKEDVTWYLSLAYLAVGKQDEAVDKLTMLANKVIRSKRKLDAQELLKIIR